MGWWCWFEGTPLETLDEAAEEAFTCKSRASMPDVAKGLAERNQMVKEVVRKERVQTKNETEMWSREVIDTERKMELERFHQKESFGK